MTLVSGASPQSTLINTAFLNPLAVVVSSPAGDPVAGGLVTFTAPSSGASAILTGSPATIAANGRAAVTAKANGILGNYEVQATATGAGGAIFKLANSVLSGLTALTVKWGTAGKDALVVPDIAGGLMLPAGRQTDVPWLGINQFVVTLSRSMPLTRNDVTITSAIRKQYGPITVTGSGMTYTIKLGTPITQPDIVTLKITGTGSMDFEGVLPVLPADFNDNGRIENLDEVGLLAEIFGHKPTIFGDINGDGLVNLGDYQALLGFLRNTLPPRTAAKMAASVSLSALSGAGSAVGTVPTPRAEIRLAGRSKIRIGGSPSRVVVQRAQPFRDRTLLSEPVQVS